jgi:hypothetical protein
MVIQELHSEPTLAIPTLDAPCPSHLGTWESTKAGTPTLLNPF